MRQKESTTPFTDVPAWAGPYVGYAYENGLTKGVSDTAFGSKETVTAAEYLTFVLRALGYDSETDFQWDAPWALSDQVGLTSGQYGEGSDFLRGDAAVASDNALGAELKDGSAVLEDTLIGTLGCKAWGPSRPISRPARSTSRQNRAILKTWPTPAPSI